MCIKQAFVSFFEPGERSDSIAMTAYYDTSNFRELCNNNINYNIRLSWAYSLNTRLYLGANAKSI